MPNYEYEATLPAHSCAKCRSGFEIAQALGAPRLTACPAGGAPVRKLFRPPPSAVPDLPRPRAQAAASPSCNAWERAIRKKY